jgi:hypothetical protein
MERQVPPAVLEGSENNVGPFKGVQYEITPWSRILPKTLTVPHTPKKFLTYFVVECLKLLFRIWEIPGSYLSPETRYPY